MKAFLSKSCISMLLIAAMFLSMLTGISFPGIHPAAAAANYTWNNVIPVKTPAPGTSNGKLVLFDNSHAATAGAADWVLDGGFSDFADALVQAGYTVKEYRGIDKNGDGAIRFYDDRFPENVALNESIITYDAIKDADVFVIAEANRPLRQTEYAALKQFVDSGKGIYFIADHYNADRNMNTWDSTEVFNGYNRSTSSTYNMGGEYGDMRNPGIASAGWLSQSFGVRFRFNAINYTTGVSGIKTPSETEGITNGVSPVLMAAGSTLAITDANIAKGLIYFGTNDTPTKWGSAVDQGLYFGGEAEGPYVAISKPSAGKAAFIGDSSPIEDITPKYKREDNGQSKSAHDGWKNAGNAAKLSLNIVNWLATQESYAGFDGINHAKGVLTPTPMADVEKNITQAEPWATPSYDPWNTDTFAYGSYGAANGSSSTATPTPTTTPSTAMPDLIISEYVEGSSNNKALEIYNPTSSSKDLSQYSLVQYNNGSTAITYTLSLSGTLAPGATYVIVNSSASSTLLAKANLSTSSSVLTFNGNDAVALRKGGTLMDIIGTIGQNPGTEWGTGNTSTADNTLVRKSTITVGDGNGSDGFDPSTEWIGYPMDTFSYVGSHSLSATPTPTPIPSPTPTPTPPSADTDLIISEYVEGSSNNKAIEIYNGTGSSIDLSQYSLVQYNNGSSSVTYTLPLSGTIAAGSTYVIANSSASSTLLAKANLSTSNSVLTFNGDDVVALRKGTSLIDVIGTIGIDPGTEWGTGDTSTADNTLVRKSSVTSGDANGSDAFDPAVQWIGYTVDTFSYLGSR